MSLEGRSRHPRVSLAQEVKDYILVRILEGVLKPGDRLIEMRIANEMNTSQAPVREAIRELEALGVVETSRNRGARVRIFDLRDIQEIYDVRAELESYAVRLIHSRGTLDAKTLDAAIARMREAAARGDAMDFAEQNASFHRAMVQQAGNSILSELWDVLDIKSRTFLNIMNQTANLGEIAESHVAVVKALKSKDEETSSRTIRAHILENKPK